MMAFQGYQLITPSNLMEFPSAGFLERTGRGNTGCKALYGVMK